MIQGVSPTQSFAQAQPDRLREVSRQFESIFLEMVLKQMRAATRSLSDKQSDMARDTYEGWQDEHFARAMTAGTGMGLGEALYRQLQQQALARQADETK